MANVYVRSGASGANNGTSKTDAYTTLSAAFAAGSAGDRFYVASDHAEVTAGAVTLTCPGTAASWCEVVCVDFAGSTPPVAADLRTTASIAVSGGNDLVTAGGWCYWYGVTLSAASGSSSSKVSLLSSSGHHVMENCSVVIPTTSSAQQITIGNTTSTTGFRLDFINTTVGFGHVNQTISVRNMRMNWRKTASAIRTDGSYVVPTSLFSQSTRNGTVICEGVDFSAAGSGKTLFGTNNDPCHFYLKDCKLDAAVTIASTPGTSGAGETIVMRSDSGATSYRLEKYQYQGTQTVETTLVRTGGASDGTTAFSHKLATSANARWAAPLEMQPVVKWNATTGSSVTATVEGVWNAAALPNNDEIWLDLEYLGTSGNPLGLISTGGKASLLATAAALSASTQAWDSLVTSRANSTAYSVGDVRKVATNSGRVFFCTTAGTSASSEPAGYASAVDGGSVTDGTAVFRAGVRFKMEATFTAQIAGACSAYIRAAKASSTFYVDPKVALA